MLRIVSRISNPASSTAHQPVIGPGAAESEEVAAGFQDTEGLGRPLGATAAWHGYCRLEFRQSLVLDRHSGQYRACAFGMFDNRGCGCSRSSGAPDAFPVRVTRVGKANRHSRSQSFPMNSSP